MFRLCEGRVLTPGIEVPSFPMAIYELSLMSRFHLRIVCLDMHIGRFRNDPPNGVLHKPAVPTLAAEVCYLFCTKDNQILMYSALSEWLVARKIADTSNF